MDYRNVKYIYNPTPFSLPHLFLPIFALLGSALASSSFDGTTLDMAFDSSQFAISVDNTEYQPGELITITFKNNSSQPIWFLNLERNGRNPWWNIERLENGSWNKGDVWKTHAGQCILTAFEKVPESTLTFRLESGSRIIDQWNMMHCTVKSPVGPVFSKQQLAPANYRVSVSYGFGERSWNAHTAYSEIFLVKGDKK